LEARLPSERLSFQRVEKASKGDSDTENLKPNETVAEQGVAKPGVCNRTRLLQISTAASLNEMIAPGALVMLSPVVTGALFGTKTLAGLLAGSLVSGVQVSEGGIHRTTLARRVPSSIGREEDYGLHRVVKGEV
jgi:hypothetical protein